MVGDRGDDGEDNDLIELPKTGWEVEETVTGKPVAWICE